MLPNDTLLAPRAGQDAYLLADWSVCRVLLGQIPVEEVVINEVLSDGTTEGGLRPSVFSMLTWLMNIFSPQEEESEASRDFCTFSKDGAG
mmetsp:Transcript_36938/g.80893  ORF Transcript_36938/g.80893 Transcript_36938/m.80893 type:complete len:90 (+) Transcript_36938:605-874(+)